MSYSTPYSSIPPAGGGYGAPRGMSDNGGMPILQRSSYTPLDDAQQLYPPIDQTTQMALRPSLQYDDHQESYGSYNKEAGSDYYPLTAAGAGGAAGGAAGYQAFDPQGRTGSRYAALQAQRDSQAGAGADYENAWHAGEGSGSGASKKKWWWIGGIILLLLVGLGVGLGVGLTVGKNDSSSPSSSSSGKSSGSDVSNFEKDSRLHNSFWAFAYTPQDVQYGTCGATQANVTRDIQLLSQLTTRIRLYGANCNQTALVLQAIQDTKVDLNVYVAIYIDSNTDAYESQIEAVEDALKTYGTDHVLGVTVGNEYILNNKDDQLGATQKIIKDVAEVRKKVDALKLDKQLPFGTSDAGSMFTTTLAEGIDYFHANVHPWFGAVPIQDAATWTWSYFQENNVDVAAQASNKPDTAIAETGWPTGSDDAADKNNGATGAQGDASAENLQEFLDTFVCEANNNGTHYFFFEAFDEPWKKIYGGVEPHWGLFDEHRNLKDLKIPDCKHD